MSVSVQGVSQTIRALRNAGAASKRGLVSGVTKASILLAQEAQLRAPKFSHNLERGIVAIPASGNGSTVKGEVLSQAEYSAQVEYGHGDAPPEPFLRPAVDHKGQEAAGLVGRDVANELGRV